jgi:hypothetical protein
MDVEAADLDADGDLDLVVANEFMPNVILLNDGAGTFAYEPLPAPTGTVPPNWPARDSEDVAIADLDGDGRLDLVIVSEDDVRHGGSGVHELYLGDGTGHFTATTAGLPDTEANAVTVADLSGDGAPDLLIGNAGQDRLLVNDGAGQFTDVTAERLPTEGRTNQDLELADLDGDGDLDLVVGNEDGNRLLVNDGTGRFTDETAGRFPTTPTVETRKVTPADVDGDGDLDLFFANVGWRGTNPQDRLFLNDGTGHFTDETAARLPASSLTSLDGKPVDLDGDGDLDLVVVGSTLGASALEPAPVEVYRNDGTGHFARADDLLADTPVLVNGLGVEVADLNGDGHPDLFFADRGRADRLFLHAGTTTGIGEVPDPARSGLEVFPNPARDGATVRYALAEAGAVRLDVIDALGRVVQTAVGGVQEAGRHEVVLDGRRLPAGVYTVRLRAGARVSTRRMTRVG